MRNRIGCLLKENGGWVKEEGEKEFIVNHFI